MDRLYYAFIEVGMRKVSLSNMAKIAAGFDLSLSEFLLHVGDDAPL